MKNYPNIDNELLFMAEETSEEAASAIINKYSNLISIAIAKYSKFLNEISLEDKDLYQEGLLGLLEAINTFDKDKNIQFNTYASKCIDNKIKSILRYNSTFKYYHANNSVSLDNDSEDINYYELINKNSLTPEDKILIKEELEEINKIIKEKFTSSEYQIYLLKIKGYKNSEISTIINKDKKQIETTITRINKKLKEIKSNTNK